MGCVDSQSATDNQHPSRAAFLTRGGPLFLESLNLKNRSEVLPFRCVAAR